MNTTTYTGQKLEPFQDPKGAVTDAGVFVASQTLAKGTVLGIVTASKKYSAYVDANSNGTEVAKAICMYDIVVDANGKVSFGTGTTGDKGELYDSAPVYIAGTFRTTELVGLDAAGVADLGRLIWGTAADGVLRIG